MSMFHGTAGRASELKQQGALEAAGDPNSSVTVAQAEDTVLHESQAAGAAAFTFDPDASPAAKAAQLKEVSRPRCELGKHELTLFAASAGPEASPETPDGSSRH